MKTEISKKLDKSLPVLEEKAAYFLKCEQLGKKEQIKTKKEWYFSNCENYKQRLKIRLLIRKLLKWKLPLYLDFLRWVVVDILRGKEPKFFGIYQFVALPGEGKTMSMVAHIERARGLYPDGVYVATNISYKHNDMRIRHWTDIIKASQMAQKLGKKCIVGMDEVHTTFDSSDWKSFPQELLALLSFDRKLSLQFLCTAQIYDRIPKKIRDIANYTVICKNVWGADRLFRSYYFSKTDYEDRFTGKKKNAQFIQEFVAGDDFYGLYDTKEIVDRMVTEAKEEKRRKEEAFNLLFGSLETDGSN